MSFSLSPLGVLKGSLFTSWRSSAKKTFLYRRRESWYYFAFQLITSGSSSLLFDVIKTLLCQTKNNFLWTALISVTVILHTNDFLKLDLWWNKNEEHHLLLYVIVFGQGQKGMPSMWLCSRKCREKVGAYYWEDPRTLWKYWWWLLRRPYGHYFWPWWSLLLLLLPSSTTVPWARRLR